MARKPKATAKATPARPTGPKKPKIKAKHRARAKIAPARRTAKNPKQAALIKATPRTARKPDMANPNKITVTVACPVGMVDAGNQFALTVGLTEADVDTFGDHSRETIGGNDYYLASLNARASFMHVPYADLSDAATDKGATLAQAETAQDALVIWEEGDGDVPAPAPDKLTVIVQAIYAGAGQAALDMFKAAAE